MILHFGNSPAQAVECVCERLPDIKNIVIAIEFTDDTNGVYYNDMQNGYEVVGRLMSMIKNIQERQEI